MRPGWARARVPATSANLGPGFDVLGLALALHDELAVRIGPPGLRVAVRGEGVGVPQDETHLVIRAMRAAFERLHVTQPDGIELDCTNTIPHGRGLGSSAAAIVAGILLARELLDDGRHRLRDAEAFALAAELEGHPDNVAPCLFGGLTVSWDTPAGARARALPVDPQVLPVLLIPTATASTAHVRGLLPASVPHADAPFSSARTGLLVALLSGLTEWDALTALDATEDRLHQQHRASAMPGTADLVAELRAAGLPAVVSGAGPSVLVLTRAEVEVERVSALVPADWRCAALAVDAAGAQASYTAE